VLLDLHAYNFRREGPNKPPAEQKTHPEVNIGTGSLDHKVFGNLLERFMRDMHQFDYLGRHLDVRENVKFKGRHLAHWIHNRFPKKVCVIAVEFKKFFMDEWTGIGDIEKIEAIRDALQSTVPGLLQELECIEG
jgi:hypothetical protein